MAENEEKKPTEVVQVKLPPEISPLLNDLKVVRAKNLEPLTNTSIIIDAVKEYHKNRVVEG